MREKEYRDDRKSSNERKTKIKKIKSSEKRKREFSDN
jgi:hypothetical protein